MKSQRKQALRNRVGEIKPLLETDGEFMLTEFDKDYRNLVQWLQKNGALRRKRKERLTEPYSTANGGSGLVCVWEWVDEYKEFLKDELNRHTSFPNCSHRVHICNREHIDGLSCRKCLEAGEEPQYDKEEIKRLL